MLDLNDPTSQVAAYEIKIASTVFSYDALILGYKIRVLEGVEDPAQILATVRSVLGLKDDVPLSSFEACMILEDFEKFARANLDEPLKKVFGRSLYSDTTTASDPEILTDSVPENIEDSSKISP